MHNLLSKIPVGKIVVFALIAFLLAVNFGALNLPL